MKKVFSWLPSLLLLCLFSCSTEPVSDQMTNFFSQEESFLSKGVAVERPLTINGAGDYAIFPGDGESCSQLVLSAVGTGQATHLGATSFQEGWCWNGNPDDLGVRTTSYVAANGDELHAMPISILFTGPNSFQEESIITGGTGRFEDAEGSYLVFVETTPASEVGGTFVLTATGTIKY